MSRASTIALVIAGLSVTGACVEILEETSATGPTSTTGQPSATSSSGSGGGGVHANVAGVGVGGTSATGSTSAAGGAPPESCDPYEPRQTPPEVFIGPGGLQAKIVSEINVAQVSIDLFMYQFSVKAIADALIAAQKKGVTVRVLLDLDQTGNGATKSKLVAAGVEVKAAPATFEHGHAKAMVIDAKRAMIMGANFNLYSMQTERNYGVIVVAEDDIADLQAIFERDWSGSSLDLSCTRLVVAPENARERIIAHIDGAKQKLDLAIMYLSDKDALSAIKARAAAGVPTRVLLADPAWIADNSATAAELEAAGIPTKFFKKLDLHAKLIVADGAAFVGSENLSWTSLEKNREVGLFVSEPTPLGKIVAQFETDWAAGVD